MIMNTEFNKFTDTELAQEQWRDVDGYDGMYQVSDLGRVRSKHSGEWKVMKQGRQKDGYLRVVLSKDKKVKYYLTHRLVAQAFIPNIDETNTIINHINEDKTDERVSNLEWCDYKYNNTYNNLQSRKKNSKYPKIKDLYNPDLTIKQNIEVFRSKGIECSKIVIRRLRRDLGLTNNKRTKVKDLYNPNLTYAENLEIFRANGVECSRYIIKRLRRELGLTRDYRPRKKTN